MKRLLIVSCVLSALTIPLDAQRRPSAARIHAAACVGELGWAAPDEACAALVEVHVARARDTTPEVVAQRFSQALRNPPPDRAWVPELISATSSRAPRSWPARLPWAPWRMASLHRYEAVATSVLSGERPIVCPDCINYGGLMDAQPPGTEEVRRFVLRSCEGQRRCVPRAQIFYRRAVRSAEES